MNRQDFGEWGIELKPEEFAGALAYLLRQLYNDTPTNILAKLVLKNLRGVVTKPIIIGVKEFAGGRDKPDDYSPIFVCFDSTFHQLDFYSFRLNAADLFGKWLDFVKDLQKNHQVSEEERYVNSQYRLLPRPFRLRFELLTNPENAFWLSEQLSQLNDGDASVYLRIDEPGTEVGWNWALRVGFLKDENSLRLREELERFVGEKKRWLGNLVEFVFLDSENDNCDLLIIPEGLRSALSAALKLNVKVSADCVLIIGRTNENPEDIPALIDALRRLISTAGVGIVNVPPEKRIYWFTELIRELSHDEPIDVALFAACRMAETPTPFLVASDKLIRFSRLVESIKSIGEKLKKFGTDEIIEVFGNDAYNFGIDSGSYNWKDLGEKLIRRSNDFRIDREETSATSAVNVNREIKEKISTEAKPKKNEIRWIQSQVYDLSNFGEKRLLRRALRRNAPHEAVVRIGLSSEDWIQSEERFPAEKLPPDKESYNLVTLVK